MSRAERLARIAEMIATATYDLRAASPDLTLWRDGESRFVEVNSSSNQMHANSYRHCSYRSAFK